jgi:hypothetical protein
MQKCAKWYVPIVPNVPNIPNIHNIGIPDYG